MDRNLYCVSSNPKKGKVVIFILYYADLKTKKIIIGKQGHHTIMRGSIL